MAAKRRYVAITTRLRDIPADILLAHRARIEALYGEGTVVASGGFAEGGGLILFDAASVDDVEALMREDPFVVNQTHSYIVRTWLQDVGEP